MRVMETRGFPPMLFVVYSQHEPGRANLCDYGFEGNHDITGPKVTRHYKEKKFDTGYSQL